MLKNDPILVILGVPKMVLRVPESKFRNHFSIQTSPQNPQKDTSGTQIGPRKVIFGHFAFFWYFYLIFPLARALFFKSISTHQKLTPDKKENFSQLLKHLNQRKNTSPMTNYHFFPSFSTLPIIKEHGQHVGRKLHKMVIGNLGTN